MRRVLFSLVACVKRYLIRNALVDMFMMLPCDGALSEGERVYELCFHVALMIRLLGVHDACWVGCSRSHMRHQSK